MAVKPQRAGYTLLELIVTAAMMATLMSAVTVTLRSSQNAWEGHESDHARLEAGHAVLRHMIRHIRQAQGVTSISDPSDLSGSLTVQRPNGSEWVWEHSGTGVNFGTGVADNLLAEPIQELVLTGYRADGSTATSVPAEVQLVHCSVTVPLTRGSEPARTLSAWAWLRTW